MADKYRIRWGRIGGRRYCIAERQIKIFGIPLFYFPVLEGRWRQREIEAQWDIDGDIAYRKKLPKTKYFEV